MAASHNHCSKSIWMHLDNLSWEKPNIWSCALCHSTDFGNIAGHRVCVSSSLVHRNSTVLSKVLRCLISPREETQPSAVPDKIDYCCSQRSETKKVKQSTAYSRNIWLYIQPAKPLIIKLGERVSGLWVLFPSLIPHLMDEVFLNIWSQCFKHFPLPPTRSA